KTMTKFVGAPVGSGESDVLRIRPRPIFGHSTSCNLIQLVDVIAFIAIGNSRAMPSETFVNLHAQLKPYISHTAYITAR
ncbi:MAG: hypothetical protein OXD41_02465, partial [Thaumarchaeota archaeon]|nr:hypothetical protein [Nitrososphaerota archaeon]